MSDHDIQYLSQDKYDALEKELEQLKSTSIPEIAHRIDEAKQLGDLSENAEYHQAKEDMGWAQGRVKEIGYILGNAQIIDTKSTNAGGKVVLGSRIVVRVNKNEKEYTIVGAQEANPIQGMISNESPLGEAFMGKHVGDTVHVEVPAGVQTYTLLDIK